MAAKRRLRVALRHGRSHLEADASRVARAAGYEFRRQHFYLPFPNVERLPESLWQNEHPTPGVDLRIDAAAELLRDLGDHIRQFPVTNFAIKNGSYEWVDAETLYGLLCHVKPRRLIELGSGASSQVIALAQAANAKDDAAFAYESYDPFPDWHERGNVPGGTVRPVAAEDIDPSAVDALESDDVLFVDTTHTVRTGGDVAHIVLNLLPRLAPGVYVHFHDIFLPYEYPREWVVEMRRAWAEQYLLQAFLAMNPDFEVVLPVHALIRQQPNLVRQLVPSFAQAEGTGGAAFWIRRLER
jgi:Methyltransferase domain